MIYLVSNTKYEDEGVVNLNLTQISFKKFEISNFNALIFTSKNGVNALKFNQISPNLSLQIYSIGKATTKALQEFGFSQIYTAKSEYGDSFAYEILPLLKGKNVGFVSASENVSNLFEILLKNGVEISKIIAYENEILKANHSLKPPAGSFVIFTSPKNVKAFLKNFNSKDYKAVAIGKKTFEYLDGFKLKFVSPEPYIDKCVKFTKNLKNSLF